MSEDGKIVARKKSVGSGSKERANEDRWFKLIPIGDTSHRSTLLSKSSIHSFHSFSTLFSFLSMIAFDGYCL